MNRLFPVVIDGYGGDASAWLRTNRARVDSVLSQSGALLLREFSIRSEAEFSQLVREFSNDVLEYVYRSTPRTSVAEGVFTATEYPAGLKLSMHNENAYQQVWPLHILFCCLEPAESGGQTPIASNMNITRRIDPLIRKKFLEKGVMYIRNYRPDIDLPWQEVFQTSSKSSVEQYCRANDIHFEWTNAGNLRTVQQCKAMARHPKSGTMLWFNSAHMFHPSNLDPKSQQMLRETMPEDDYPRNVKLGDGSPISEAELDNIREAFREEETIFPWRSGDVLMLDNMSVCHGRMPYKGRRRVLTAMCNSSSRHVAKS